MAQEKRETRAQEVARVRGYLASQAMRRTPAQLVEALREAQQQLVAAVVAIPDVAFRTIPGEGEWSAADVLAHVRTIAAFDERSICGVIERGEQPANVDDVLEVQDLWLKKQRDAAAARIPDELVLKTNLIGTEDMVRERLRAYQHAGVNTLQVNPDGEMLDEWLATLARLVELVKEINAEP